MLAQNFKTPADLRITDAEFAALARVLAMLERGELRHVEDDACNFENGFNMGTIRRVEQCGTTACICGWAQIISDVPVFESFEATDAEEWREQPDALIELFKFGRYSHEVDRISDAQAAIALRNYLTNGEPCWEEALA